VGDTTHTGMPRSGGALGVLNGKRPSAMRIGGFRHVALMLALRCAAIEWAISGLPTGGRALARYLDVLRGMIAQRRFGRV
jgi:hypothetical protein